MRYSVCAAFICKKIEIKNCVAYITGQVNLTTLTFDYYFYRHEFICNCITLRRNVAPPVSLTLKNSRRKKVQSQNTLRLQVLFKVQKHTHTIFAIYKFLHFDWKILTHKNYFISRHIFLGEQIAKIQSQFRREAASRKTQLGNNAAFAIDIFA